MSGFIDIGDECVKKDLELTLSITDILCRLVTA